MSTVIDFAYAANADELKTIIDSMIKTAKAEHRTLNKDNHFHPSIVQLGGMQIKAVLESRALEDGSFVFDLRFHFMSEDAVPQS